MNFKTNAAFTQPWVAAALLLGALLPALPARATSVLPFLQPTGIGIAATSPVNNAFPITSATTPQSNWVVTQWGDPNLLLPAFVKTVGSTLTNYTAASSRSLMLVTQANSGGFSFKMNQNGATLSCGTATGPLEYDQFLTPNTAAFNPAYPSALLTDVVPGSNVGLGTMTSLVVKGNVHMSASAAAAANPQCVVNQGALLYAIIVKNTVVQPPQVLYYQIDLTALQCAPGTSPSQYAFCQTYRPGTVFFEENPITDGNGTLLRTEYGVDDPLTSYKIPLLTVSSKPTALYIDILPQLAAIIRAGSPALAGVAALDNNLANWRLSGMYYGQHIWGDIAITSQWSGLVPVATY